MKFLRYYNKNMAYTMFVSLLKIGLWRWLENQKFYVFLYMDKNTEQPHMVRVKNFKIDSDYSSWLSDIIIRYRSAQIKSTVKVNYEKLQFNWSIGRDLVSRKAEEHWGVGVVEQLSFDLQNAFPHEKGFSSRNMWKMKQWYLFFSTPEATHKLSLLWQQLQSSESQSLIKLPQAGAEFHSISAGSSEPNGAGNYKRQL